MLASTISTLFPYTTLFRSGPRTAGGAELALHISNACGERLIPRGRDPVRLGPTLEAVAHPLLVELDQALRDRKSTRLNSSHPSISYAVFCLKKKKESPSRD